MSDSAIITREQVRTVFIATELGGKTGDSSHFSYAQLGRSTYSFGQLQFDVGNNDAAKDFLKENGFSATDIADLGARRGLSRERLNALDAQLEAVPPAEIAKFTNEQLDKTIARVGDVIDSVRRQNPVAADAIAKDSDLQLGIADYINQFGSAGPQLLGFLAENPQTLAGGKVKAGSPPTREDIQTFIGAGNFGQDPANARGIESRAHRLEEALDKLDLGHASRAVDVIKNSGATLKEHAHGAAVSKLQNELAELGYTDAKGRLLQADGHFGHATEAAVKTFQADHGLTPDGRVGPATQRAMQDALQPLKRDDPGLLPAVSTMSSLSAAAPSPDDPRNALNPRHALYNELQRRLPDASENRLLQFTAACHENNFTADNLSTIHLNRETGKIGFTGTSLVSLPAIVDLNMPAPEPRQSIQRIQQVDQQQAQIQAQAQGRSSVQGQQETAFGGR